ncbi:hypothetical protein PoB_004243300 [Plakobranchus ocellatus]|uniref:Uncharacterized protein n=1 Tax=Plakobranchus ocellatus TaxID=259542 RepID=A0AAV4BAU2_9GAST|nr:hypothetical protein PoB_004243300 [Plakobranchus ocellatus]
MSYFQCIDVARMERNIFQTLDVVQGDSNSEMSEEAEDSGKDGDWQPPTECVNDENDGSSSSSSESDETSTL